MKRESVRLSLFIILVALTSIFSCNKSELETFEIVVTPEIEEYWQKFINEAEERGIDLRLDTLNFSIDFADLDSISHELGGKCYAIPGGDILIDIDTWETLDLVRRELLINHELGHCVLGRHHTNTEGYLENNLRDYECISLMTSCLCGSSCGLDYHSTIWREYYLGELFGVAEIPEWLDKGEDYEEFVFEEIVYDVVDTSGFGLYIPYGQLGEENYQVELRITGQENFKIEKNDLVFDFVASNGQIGITVDGILVFDLAYINAWMGLNEDWWNTSFTFRHIDGVDYFYLKEKLIHSREGNSRFDTFRIHFEEEVNYSATLYKN